ncbi:MAG: sialate O-acetylesterase [Planctomycetaceae bacterium]|nr:sialate O-acetylesterase [Planctomycetaceae bacterium]
MKRAALAGVRITHGPSDWQVLQRRLDNTVDIPLGGTWLDPSDRMAAVEVRVVDEQFQRPPAEHLDWHLADTSPDRTWRHVLEGVPAGGPYRLETRLRMEGDAWRLAGDQIHHLCVGDLWIIAGDDNALGFGHGAVDDPPEFGVHMFRKNERWSLASHPTHDVTGLRNARFFSSGAPGHSPWLTFGRLIRRETGIPVGLIPAAQEGTILESWYTKKRGMPTPAFDNLLALIWTATSLYDFANFSLHDGGPRLVPKPETPPGIVAGCVWFGGNGDCRREGAAANYGQNFKDFIGKLRAVLEAPHLPLVVCQLNRVIGVSKPGESHLWGLVREAQRAAAHDLDNVAVIPTLDAGLSDGIHISATGNVVIGERAARAALGLVYGKTSPWRTPDFHDAWFPEGKRNVVILEFANVSGELRPVAGEISSLIIGDGDGGAAIRKVKQIGPNCIQADLIRELGTGAVVSFCAGHNPPLAFVDDNNCPPLAFANIAIRDEMDE